MVHQKYLSDNDTLEQRIDKIIEEAAEVIQIVLKMKRFGPFSYHPNDPEKKSNIQLLSSEVDDVVHALKRISDFILVDDSSVVMDEGYWIDESHEMYDSEINDYDRICRKCGTNSNEDGNVKKLIEPCKGNKSSIKSFGTIV